MVGFDILGNPPDILRLLDEADTSVKQVVVYPDKENFRKIYCKYTKKHLEKDNEIVVLLPYYETVESAIDVLHRNGIDVEKYGRLGFLLVRDAYRTYSGFQEDRELLFRRIINHAVAHGKAGVAIILDMGAFSLIADMNRLAVSYRSILPQSPLLVRGLLSYHRRDYAKLSRAKED